MSSGLPLRIITRALDLSQRQNIRAGNTQEVPMGRKDSHF
jgi:hypothetical protein